MQSRISLLAASLVGAFSNQFSGSDLLIRGTSFTSPRRTRSRVPSKVHGNKLARMAKEGRITLRHNTGRYGRDLMAAFDRKRNY